MDFFVNKGSSRVLLMKETKPSRENLISVYSKIKGRLQHLLPCFLKLVGCIMLKEMFVFISREFFPKKISTLSPSGAAVAVFVNKHY
jgi:hypothetical protein